MIKTVIRILNMPLEENFLAVGIFALVSFAWVIIYLRRKRK